MDDCCATSESRRGVEKNVCPTCGQTGKPVRALTIRSLTHREWPGYPQISDGYLCPNPEDSTVYFVPGLKETIHKANVVDRIGIKETEEPIYVCYCFRHTKAEIESDFLQHGRSTIEEDIRQKVKNNLCSCEVTNPSGRCCLGDIRKTYRREIS